MNDSNIIKPLPIISIGNNIYDQRWISDVTYRYGIARLHLKYARRYLENGSVDQFWGAMKAFIKARSVARIIRKLSKSGL